MVRINIKQNGGLLDFIFPIGQKLRVEAVTKVKFDGTNTEIYREFCTLRSFVIHYFYEFFINPAKRFAERLAISSQFAFQIGAIAVDATSGATKATSTSTVSVSHTTTGSNRVLASCVGDAAGSGPAANGWQYASVNLSTGATSTANEGWTSVYYLIAPATGANTLTYTSNTGTFSADVPGFIAGISFTGAKQSGQPDATGTTTGASVSSSSISITTVADNSYIVDDMMTNGGNAAGATPGGSQTQIGTTQSGNTVKNFGASYKQLVTAGATTMTWAWQVAGPMDAAAISIAPAPSAGGSTLQMMGIA